MDKIKKWVVPSFDDDESETASNKKQKTSSNEDINEQISFPGNGATMGSNEVTATKMNSSLISSMMSSPEDWMRQFEPKSVEDLAVHSKKIQEVESWLCGALRSRGEVLLLSGPVGSGKTAVVRVLADKHNVRIREWITPLDTDLISAEGNFEYRERQANVFRKFLVDAGCYTSLLQSQTNTLLLVEDYPNTLLRNHSEFAEAIQHYKDRRASAPLVFVCAECRSENKETAYNMFSPALKERFNIHHITFNSISATGMRMALKRASNIMSKKFGSVYAAPSPQLQDCVANSSAGDVRSALLNLHFASLKGIKTRPSEQKVRSKESSNRRGKKASQSRFGAIGKDETVSLLHAVGRVLNPKLVESGERLVLSHRPTDIVLSLSSAPATLLGFLHENYLPHFADAESVARAAAVFSDADLMLTEWREKQSGECGLLVCVWGVMRSNKAPVSAWRPVRAPRHLTPAHLTPKEIPLLEENQLYTGKVLISDYKTYCNIITASQDSRLVA